MHIFVENESVSHLYKRMLSLNISKKFASSGNGDYLYTLKQNSEQSNRRRKLLQVEEKAKQNKIIAEHGENHFRMQVTDQLSNKISSQINEYFYDKQILFSQILQIEDASTAILDILAARAASIHKIKPLINNLPWLADELIHLVNKPQYRKRTDVPITNASVAISYIGLDNLKSIMPTFVLKHWLPRSTLPFSLMKRKLWNDSLSIALAASALAKDKDIDEYSVFTAAMLSNLGRLAVTKSYLRVFHDIYNEELNIAFKNKDKKLHETILSIKASPEILLEQLVQQSAKISAEMVELMNLEYLPASEPLFDLAYSVEPSNMHPIAQLIIKAQAYVIFRNLANENMINPDEIKLLFTVVNMDKEDIAILKKSDIDHLKLKFS